MNNDQHFLYNPAAYLFREEPEGELMEYIRSHEDTLAEMRAMRDELIGNMRLLGQSFPIPAENSCIKRRLILLGVMEDHLKGFSFVSDDESDGPPVQVNLSVDGCLETVEVCAEALCEIIRLGNENSKIPELEKTIEDLKNKLKR